MKRKSKAERRRELLDAARDTFVEKGFQAATIDDIVAQAAVARGTFYLYFRDKRAVFEALVDAFLARIGRCVKSIDLSDPTPPVAQLHANIRRIVVLALEEPTIVKLALYDATGLDPELDEKIQAFYEGLRSLIDESLEEGQALGMVRGGDRRVMVAIGLGGLKEVLVEAVSGRVEADPDQITAEIMLFLAGGLLSR